MLEQILNLVIAIVVGGLIGAERQFRHGLGLRTMMLVCLGSTLFTMWSPLFSANGQGDTGRVAAAIVTGIGFLGAGLILRRETGVLGLTTAAAVWLVAALGMGIAIGQYTIVGVSTVLILIVLWGVPRIDALVGARTTFLYEATCAPDQQLLRRLTAEFAKQGLRIEKQTIAKQDGLMVCSWLAYGSPSRHDRLMEAFLADPAIEILKVL